MIPAGTIFAKVSERELKSEAKGLWLRDKETPKTTLGPDKNSSTILRSDIVFLRPTIFQVLSRYWYISNQYFS